ncbi:MAG: HAD-IA family hydrolase [Selenomonas sp.]
MSLLELKDVTMAYGGKVKALDNVNLKVEKGDWLAVMGPSGSGKTTLMNIIGCMDHATSGTVLLDGIDITKVSDHELTLLRRDKIGIVFQQFHMIPYLTAIENIMAAQRLGVEPSRCVALEDSPSGVRSATAAGMKVIVVPGELEVPAELGHARMLHTELTLDAVRALG